MIFPASLYLVSSIKNTEGFNSFSIFLKVNNFGRNPAAFIPINRSCLFKVLKLFLLLLFLIANLMLFLSIHFPSSTLGLRMGVWGSMNLSEKPVVLFHFQILFLQNFDLHFLNDEQTNRCRSYTCIYSVELFCNSSPM